MGKIPNEVMEQLRKAESVEELSKMLKENGIEEDMEKTRKLYDALTAQGEISDEELEEVAAGIYRKRW